MSIRRLISGCVLLSLWVFSIGVMSSHAEQSSSRLDQLRNDLAKARDDIGAIQTQAKTVRQQIRSIDRQASAVAKALSTARELAEQLRGRIIVLEKRIEREHALYEKQHALAVGLAADLYTSGPAEELDLLVEAKGISDLLRRIEYASAYSKKRIQIMFSAQRLSERLDADRASLEKQLANVVEAQDQRAAQAQHLRELRAAQAAKLAHLRREIQGKRREARHLATESQAIARELLQSTASSASAGDSTAGGPGSSAVVPTVAGSSGFAWPISGSITSGFGERWGGTHTGLDIDCVTGAQIGASKAGTVVSASNDAAGYGLYVILDHGGGLASLYAHASDIYVSPGQSVSQGQPIEACGATGDATGDHLHFEIRVNGSPVDPLGYLP